ncbi:MAG: EVE domain-containing protein [Gammaproteobacteria bacterium]|nr:EVE domain-containing protein [Gammaproteobacteria bacterium]
MPRYWLMKSEPSCFSIDDLASCPQQITPWDGVRNFQARNFMRDDMKCGDGVLFYHSNCSPPAIVGVAEVVRESYPDFTAFDPLSDHPDPTSSPDHPKWMMVDIQFREKFKHALSLEALRQYPSLKQMVLLRKGNRLSVLPVSAEEWGFIMGLKEKAC